MNLFSRLFPFVLFVKPQKVHLPPTLLVQQKRAAWASAQSDATARVKARLEKRQA